MVVRDAVQSDVLSLDRYDLMRGMQETAQPPDSLVVPINTAPMFPPLPPLPPAGPGPIPAVPLAPAPATSARSARSARRPRRHAGAQRPAGQ